MSHPDVRIRSLEDLLAACKAEYDDQMANWRGLDTKAQGAVAIAGLFVGGLLSLTKDLSATDPLFGRILLALALACLLGAVLYALKVLSIRSIADPPGGSIHAILAADLQALSDQEAALPSRYQGYLGDREIMWRRSIADTRTGNETKARALRRAQRLLVTAVVLVGLFALIRLLFPQ